MPRASLPTIVLLGPRAAGKTTVGRALAERLGVPFVDLDDRIRARFGGRTAIEIWRTDGEMAWRGVEAEETVALLGAPHCVIALGGGTPMIEVARTAIDAARRAARATTVLLLPPLDVLTARLRRDDGARPSLTGGDVASEAQAVLATRLSTYRALADHEIVPDDGSIDASVARIVFAMEGGAGRMSGR